jgi:hypothetical protein
MSASPFFLAQKKWARTQAHLQATKTGQHAHVKPLTEQVLLCKECCESAVMTKQKKGLQMQPFVSKL